MLCKHISYAKWHKDMNPSETIFEPQTRIVRVVESGGQGDGMLDSRNGDVPV